MASQFRIFQEEQKNAAVGFTSTGECWEAKSSQSRRCGRCQHAMRGLSKPFCSSSVASHMHTKLQKGAKPIRQGFIPCSSAQAILEAWHPKQAFNYVPDLSCFNHACVTKKGACRMDQRRMWIASSQEAEELSA